MGGEAEGVAGPCSSTPSPLLSTEAAERWSGQGAGGRHAVNGRLLGRVGTESSLPGLRLFPHVSCKTFPLNVLFFCQIRLHVLKSCHWFCPTIKVLTDPWSGSFGRGRLWGHWPDMPTHRNGSNAQVASGWHQTPPSHQPCSFCLSGRLVD